MAETASVRRRIIAGAAVLGLFALGVCVAHGAASSGSGASTGPRNAHADASAATAQPTYIHEFTHPRVIMHFHPRPAVDGDFALAHVENALRRQAHAIELDLHYRSSDGAVVVNHDGPTPDSPTLAEVIQVLVRHKGRSATVHNDGRQFFLVLEPKSDDVRIFDGVYEALKGCASHLSTAAGPRESARGITAVITGGHTEEFHDHLARQYSTAAVDRLCIVEKRDYRATIRNLRPDQQPFQWAALMHAGECGRVNALHAGTDHELGGEYNIRVWFGTRSLDHMKVALASGSDAINCDSDQLDAFEAMVSAREVRGSDPYLAIRGSDALLTWRGADTNDLYLAIGTARRSGLQFPREALLTCLLESEPVAQASACLRAGDGRLVLVYTNPGNQQLSCISGTFKRLDRNLTFDGYNRPLTSPDGNRRGSHPHAAVIPDGRIVVVYADPERRIRYVTGRLDSGGGLPGEERFLCGGGSRLGDHPSIAVDGAGRIIVVYEGAEDRRLWYVSGRLDARGGIVGEERRLMAGNPLRGSAPSIAMDAAGRVIVAYDGPADDGIRYLSGRLGRDGRIVGSEFRLAAGEEWRGGHATAAFDESGNVFVLHEEASTGRLWCVQGRLDAAGKLIASRQLVTVDMGRR